MSARAVALDPFDEAVYDAVRAACVERAILGGSHAFDDSVTYVTASGIRSRLASSRKDLTISPALVTASLRRLCGLSLIERVQLVRRYKTVRPRPVPYAGYVVVGDKP